MGIFLLTRLRMADNAMVCGQDVSAMLVEDVELLLEERVNNYSLNLTVGDQTFSATADDFGMAFLKDTFEDVVKSASDNSNQIDPWAVISLDQTKLLSYFEEHLEQKRTEPVSATVVWDDAEASQLRRRFMGDFLKEFTPTAIKGNYSEIYALLNDNYVSAGVDADKRLTLETVSDAAVKLAQKHNTMVLASGKTDVVTDGKTVVYINNGVAQLAQITGTGCLLGMLCGCYLSADRGINALVTACAVLGICGELSQTEKGNGTFFVNLMDNLSVLKEMQIEKLLNIEVKTNEES